MVEPRLAGHVADGVDDAYIRRNPRLANLASEAMEKHFFG